jgi:hypothetical protein
MSFLLKAIPPEFQGPAAHPRHEHAHALLKGVADESQN